MGWQVKDFADGWIDVADEVEACKLSAEHSGAAIRLKPLTHDRVIGDREFVGRIKRITWTDLNPFTQGYVEALLSSVDLVGERLDNVDPYRAPAFSDLAPETLARIIADCELSHSHWCLPHRASDGRRFWDMRQNPGNWNNSGVFPVMTILLGDDGKVRFA